MKRYRLKMWIKSEEIHTKILEYAEQKDIDNLCKSILEYIQLAGITKEFDSWYEIYAIFAEIYMVNVPRLLPIVIQTSVQKDEPWSYEGRVWYLWSHTLASSYSWSLEYIAELDVDDAIAMMQEIAVQEQLRLEWQWALSEIAYPYNESTQKSEFKPLSRPEWMTISIQNKPPEPKQMVIPKHMLPVGNVIHAATQ